jgi:hypothetical protein
MKCPCAVVIASALLLTACTANHHVSRSGSQTSRVPNVQSHIGVLIVSGVDHFGHHYGGPVATHVLVVRSDGRRVYGRTAHNGRTMLTVPPGDYTVSARYPACQTKHVHAAPAGEAWVRLNCALP